jgi:hypothetical protein
MAVCSFSSFYGVGLALAFKTVSHPYERFQHEELGSRYLAYAGVAYSYSLNGEFYSGQWLSPVLPNHQALAEFLGKYMPIGKAVNIQELC